MHLSLFVACPRTVSKREGKRGKGVGGRGGGGGGGGGEWPLLIRWS